MDSEATRSEGRPADMTGQGAKWATPFKKQCFVNLGVYLNMFGYGMVWVFPTFMLFTYGEATFPKEYIIRYWTEINIGSCIAGNFINLGVMSLCGRRVANVISIIFQVSGWVIFFAISASNSYLLLVSRIFHSIYIGMVVSLGPILVGEYTTPKNRGAFLATISVAISMGMSVVFFFRFFDALKETAVMCTVLALIDLLIVWKSPESPSFLASKGRFEECRRVFKWLRGNNENEELEKLILRSQEIIENYRSRLRNIKRSPQNAIVTARKRNFSKPIILMIIIYIMGYWADDVVLSQDVIRRINIDSRRLDVILEIEKIILGIFSIIAIKLVKRRTIFFAAGGFNVIILLTTAIYVYTEPDFNQPLVLTMLMHLHTLVISTGIFPMLFILSGEVFPLQYRSLASGISVLFLFSNIFIQYKCIPLYYFGLSGAYALHAGVVGLCLGVVTLLLPETKDRTLQDIENEFRGQPLSPEEIHLSNRS